MTDLHRVFRVLPGESLRTNTLEHIVANRLHLEHALGTRRVLLWTESAQGPHFLMASGPNYIETEIFGYIPVEITPHEEGLVFQDLVYTPVRSEYNVWLNEAKEKTADIYECFADTGASILAVELADGVRAFAYRTRYHWQNVQ